MNKNPNQEKKKREIERKASLLYKEGLTTRQVGKIIGKSHAWVALIVKKNRGVNNSAIDNI